MTATVDVLNVSHQFLRRVTVEQAFHLLWLDKAVAATDEIVAVLHSVKAKFAIPAVIKLKRYVKPLFGPRWSRRRLFDHYGWRCGYCGCKLNRTTATVDHIVPRVQGGKSNWSNTVPACFKCNNKKRDRTPEQAGMQLTVKLSKPKK